MTQATFQLAPVTADGEVDYNRTAGFRNAFPMDAPEGFYFTEQQPAVDRMREFNADNPDLQCVVLNVWTNKIVAR